MKSQILFLISNLLKLISKQNYLTKDFPTSNIFSNLLISCCVMDEVTNLISH